MTASQSMPVLIATESRLLRRTCEALLGICGGLLADGELNDREIIFLSTWLSENGPICRTWPAEVLHMRVREVLADGVITSDERMYLMSTLEQMIGGSFAETGAVPSSSSTLPVETNVMVEIPGRSFCFTGQFLYGTRAACERAITKRGGHAHPNLTRKTDYLVIGELASRAWKNTAHGTKIESAVTFQKAGSNVRIVSEQAWTLATNATAILLGG